MILRRGTHAAFAAAVLAVAMIALVVGGRNPAKANSGTTTTIEPTSQHATFRMESILPGTVEARLTVGVDLDDVYRSAVKFDLSALPAGARVTRATLKLYHDGTCFRGTQPAGVLGPCTKAHSIEAHGLLAAWTPTSLGSDLRMDDQYLSYTSVPSGAPAQWLSFDVSEVAASWTDPGRNFGVVLKRAGEQWQAGGVAPRSATDPDPALRPKLEVTYLLPGVYTYDAALAAGMDLPENDPALPLCPDDDGPDAGFATPDAAEADATETAPECQVDVRASDVLVGGFMRHSNAHHFGGVQRQDLHNIHGVESAIQVTDPTVDHRVGDPHEHVGGRVMAIAKGESLFTGHRGYVEAGWFEESEYAGQFAFSCITNRYDDQVCLDHRQKIRVSGHIGKMFKFRAWHCGPAGALRVCASIKWLGRWRRLGTYPNVMKCTNSNGTGNCDVEVYTEISSADSTPHPSLGGSGMAFAATRLMTDSNSWPLWTTAYAAIVESEGDPLTVRWGNQYYRFRVCNTQQPGTCDSI